METSDDNLMSIAQNSCAKIITMLFEKQLVIKKAFSTSPSLLQGELHFLPKPLFLRKRGCNRPPVLRTATL